MKPDLCLTKSLKKRYFHQNLHLWIHRLCNGNPMSPCLEHFSPPQIRFSSCGGWGPHAQMYPWKELHVWCAHCECHFWTRGRLGKPLTCCSVIEILEVLASGRRKSMLVEGYSKAFLEAASSLQNDRSRTWNPGWIATKELPLVENVEKRWEPRE